MNNILLDTHIILWSLLSPNQLSKEIIKIINDAQENDKLFISSITLWEIAMLVHKKRIDLYEPLFTFLNSISKIKGSSLVQINASIAADSATLFNFHGDPADRIIVATTREIAGSLITRDDKILNWAQGYMKVIRG